MPRIQVGSILTLDDPDNSVRDASSLLIEVKEDTNEGPAARESQVFPSDTPYQRLHEQTHAEQKPLTVCGTKYTRREVAQAIAALILTFSITYDADIEELASFSPTNQYIDSFPGTSYLSNAFAFWPNNDAIKFLVLGYIAAYNFSFDLPKIYHGTSEMVDLYNSKSIPQKWKEMWVKANLDLPQLKKHIILALIISAVSTVNEIVNMLSIIQPSTSPEDETEVTKIFPEWLSQTNCYLGILGFFLSEIITFIETYVKFKANQPRGIPLEDDSVIPYPCSHEVISALPRAAAIIGSMLFALCAAQEVLGLDNTEKKVSWLLLINTSKGFTALAYENEFFLETLSRFLHTIEKMVMQCSFPKWSELMASAIVFIMAGLVSSLQEQLVKKYFDTNLGGSDDVKNYVITPLTILYAWQMCFTYAGSVYPYAFNIIDSTPAALKSIARCIKKELTEPRVLTVDTTRATPKIDETKYANLESKEIPESQENKNPAPNLFSRCCTGVANWFRGCRKKPAQSEMSAPIRDDEDFGPITTSQSRSGSRSSSTSISIIALTPTPTSRARVNNTSTPLTPTSKTQLRTPLARSRASSAVVAQSNDVDEQSLLLLGNPKQSQSLFSAGPRVDYGTHSPTEPLIIGTPATLTPLS
jgi:hypothetical protein